MADDPGPLTYLASTRARAESSLLELMRFPTVSTDGAHGEDIRNAAEWLVAHLQHLGFESAAILETEGYPAVTATWHKVPGRPVLLVYGHYDVQPADNEKEWILPPFAPVVEDGFIWGRGASDDKGQFMALLNGVSAYIQTGTPLPVNVTVLIEGEEEINSVHLSDLLESEAERLSCDAVVAADSLMLDRNHPVILISVRGHAFVELTVTGPQTDLHSGTFGGSVDNPINVLARMLAALQDGTTRKVLIPGFYDDVIELDQAERDRINSSPITDELGIALTGAPELAGESGYTLAERVGSRPTLDIVGITGGYTGAGKKSVLPSTAHAKISMRLVPQQSVEDVMEKLRRFLLALAPSTVSVALTEQAGFGSPPAAMDPASPWIGAASLAYEVSHGETPLLLHGGGSEPMVGLFQGRFGVPVVMPGFGLPDDGNHAPNERMDVELFHKGAEWMVAYLETLPQFLG
ncbi:MAG: M20/M25/M40 family metallo-hydrolase [Acidimicrobiia bacterium]|nr:M20/M25/M40 family metallo-hydrolase [Acidimicrobiia bacterium]